jgi:hypothetical protein
MSMIEISNLNIAGSDLLVMVTVMAAVVAVVVAVTVVVAVVVVVAVMVAVAATPPTRFKLRSYAGASC